MLGRPVCVNQNERGCMVRNHGNACTLNCAFSTENLLSKTNEHVLYRKLFFLSNLNFQVNVNVTGYTRQLVHILESTLLIARMRQLVSFKLKLRYL